jgi:hypothetical protein
LNTVRTCLAEIATNVVVSAFGPLVATQAFGKLAASSIAGLLWTPVRPVCWWS